MFFFYDRLHFTFKRKTSLLINFLYITLARKEDRNVASLISDVNFHKKIINKLRIIPEKNQYSPYLIRKIIEVSCYQNLIRNGNIEKKILG